MFLLYKIAVLLVTPPGLFVVILLALAAAALAKPRRPALAAAMLLSACAIYAMSTPAGALFITGTLETMYSAELPGDDEEAAILVLGGGTTYDDSGSKALPAPMALERLRAAVRLAQSRSGRSIMMMTGGNVFGDEGRPEAEVMRDAAVEMGYDGEVWIEAASRTTAENMKFSAGGAKFIGVKRIIIVTSAFHMPRAIASAQRNMTDIEIYQFPCGRLTDPVNRGMPSFLPGSREMYVSSLGIKEWIGIAAYRILSK